MDKNDKALKYNVIKIVHFVNEVKKYTEQYHQHRWEIYTGKEKNLLTPPHIKHIRHTTISYENSTKILNWSEEKETQTKQKQQQKMMLYFILWMQYVELRIFTSSGRDTSHLENDMGLVCSYAKSEVCNFFVLFAAFLHFCRSSLLHANPLCCCCILFIWLKFSNFVSCSCKKK